MKPIENRWLTSQRTLVIGHRGASGGAPENTLRALQLAQTQGADGVEFDVRLAADGQLVVIHDERLERTTNGIGAVADFSAAELQQFDAGAGTTIPTLDQVFETCGRDFLYNVELKDGGPQTRGVEATLAACITRHNVAANVVVSSFDQDAMRRAQEEMPPGVGLAMIRSAESPPFPDWLNADADHPHWSLVTPTYMAWAQARHYRVHVWTVNRVELATDLAQLGVHALITNHPQQIREALHPQL